MGLLAIMVRSSLPILIGVCSFSCYILISLPHTVHVGRFRLTPVASPPPDVILDVDGDDPAGS